LLNRWFSQPLAAAWSGCALAARRMLKTTRYLRRGDYGRRSLSGRNAAFITLLAAGVMLGASWWFGLRDAEFEVPDSELSGFFQLPIAVGDELPSMTAGGWVNGGSPSLDDLAGKVIVVDIWNEL
jgi:hypothetical protein